MTARSTPPPAERTTGRQGHYAGIVSRSIAFGVDIGAAWGIYTLGAAAVSLFWQLVSGHSIQAAGHPQAASLILAGWAFFYFAAQWALSGQTLGMALFGIRVVRTDGSSIGSRQAVIRALVLPVSVAVFFLGFVGILTNRRRKAWQDHAADTVVVYDWDARAAHLRWLAHHDSPGAAPAASEESAAA
jgi:uncharacterized RDD family membrane protein YckC